MTKILNYFGKAYFTILVIDIIAATYFIYYDIHTIVGYLIANLVIYDILRTIFLKRTKQQHSFSNIPFENKYFKPSHWNDVPKILFFMLFYGLLAYPNIIHKNLMIAAGVVTLILTISPALKYALHSYQLRTSKQRRLIKLVKKIEVKKNYKFAFYFSSSDLETPLHYNVWEKYLNSLNIPYIIILREKKHLKYFMDDKYKSIPVIFIESGTLLKFGLPASVTSVFYANNGFKNIEMINAFPNLRHIQLLHGDSDKPSSYSPVVRCYTDLFVSGQMAIDRYSNNGVDIQDGLATIVGRPQAEDIKIVDNIDTSGKITIAYMPTWLGYHEEARFSSLEQGAQIVRDILNYDFGREIEILFKPHPMSYKDPNAAAHVKNIINALNSNAKNNGRLLEEDAIALFNKSDIMIADISSVLIDFLYSKKPFIITNPNTFALDDFKKYPCTEGGYVLNPQASNIIDLINEIIVSDPLKEFRTTKLRDYAFGDGHMKPGKLFYQESLSVINGTDKEPLERIINV